MKYLYSVYQVDESLGGYHVPMFQARSDRFLSPGLFFTPDERSESVSPQKSLAGLKRSADPVMPSGLDLSVSLPFDMLRGRFNLGVQKKKQV